MEFLAQVINLLNVSEIENSDFLNKYFDLWVNRFENKTIAYSILTLFTKYRAYDESDIKLLTFENDTAFKKDLEILLDSPFLQVYNYSEYSFEPKHGYIVEIIRRYMTNKEIPDGERCYIEHFSELSENKEYRDKIKKRYTLYHKKHSFLNFTLDTMIVCIFAISFFFPPKDIVECFQRFFTTFVSFPSIFYIYNYSLYILSVERNLLTLFTCFYGYLSITLSYLIMDCWGIFMGICICLLAFSVLLCLSNNTVDIAKRKLHRDGSVFFQ